MTRTPIYIGNSTTIAFLTSGEPIVVNTRSIDALNYILGMEFEPNVMAVFRKFLWRDTVFLDVGANFGIYSVVAANTVLQGGRLYSFEANPETFQFLKKSLYANLALHHPSAQVFNNAVGAKSGDDVTIRSYPDAVGGASLWLNETNSQNIRSYEVRTIALDDAIPQNVVANLVKIDVEGHEPYVFEGMLELIRRSPNIRIIMEFVQEFIDVSYAAYGGSIGFQKIIREQGFSIIHIGGGSSLTIVKESEPLVGFNYILLTKTPEDDTVEYDICVESRHLSYRKEYSIDGENVLISNGRLVFGPQIKSVPQLKNFSDPIIFHGPYIDLKAGRYTIQFDGSLQGKLNLTFARDFGHPIKSVTINSFEKHVELVLDAPAKAFEIIGRHAGEFPKIELRRILLHSH
jgi:FkbM family methyltransferase